jgi:hypothetical protein
MPALVQPHCTMQDPDPAWETSFKSSLGKRQREGEEDDLDAGRLTGGMFSTTLTAKHEDFGMGHVIGGNMMGMAVNSVGGSHQQQQQEDGGSFGRFGMKRLKSTSVSTD